MVYTKGINPMQFRLYMPVKILLLAGLISFLSLGSFGMSHFAMNGMGGAVASNCPLMPGMASVCNMNPLQHIAAWQSMFTTASPQKTPILALLFLLMFAGARALIGKIKWALEPPLILSWIQIRLANTFVPRYALQEAFSNGVIHPKVF